MINRGVLDAKGKRPLVVWGAGLLLFAATAITSVTRHLQVDEAQAIYSINLAGIFRRADLAIPIELYHVVLGPIGRVLDDTLLEMIALRCIYLALLFALPLTLALCQRVMPSPLGRASVFLSGVTFGPLFRHGFEVRHDIFVALSVAWLAGVCELARASRLTGRVSFFAGLTAALAQANSFKAFVMCLPLLGFAAALAVRGEERPVRGFVRHALGFLPGFLVGAIGAAIVFESAGVLGVFIEQVRTYVGYSTSPTYRLAAWPVFWFIASRAPVHALFFAVGLFSIARRLRKREPLNESAVPLGLLVISLGATLINPTLFAYNITSLTPSVILVCAVGWKAMLEGSSRRRDAGGRTVVVGLALLGTLMSFGVCEADPYYRKRWDDQLHVIWAAERLTAPDEPVLDLTGLVSSRPPASKDWMFHSLFMAGYRAGERESIRHIIERAFPPVLVVGHYRWSWINEGDLLAVQRYYLPLSNHLWVLGFRATKDSGKVEIFRAGRYAVLAAGPGEHEARIDGRVVQAGTVLPLVRGEHALASGGQGFTFAWTGPREEHLPHLDSGPSLFEQPELPGQI